MSALLDALADEQKQKQQDDAKATPSSLLGPFHLAGGRETSLI